MPMMEIVLPGTPRTTVESIAEVYCITIERGDGIACTDIEARTAMSVYCMQPLKKTPRKVKNTAK